MPAAVSGVLCRLLRCGPLWRLQRQRLSGSGPGSRPGPPWRLLFFGSDDFAMESLKLLASSRSSCGGVVETLEVVTGSANVPVKTFAQQNGLRLHSWPLTDLQDRFDVGVVVSFGCLLQEKVISMFPYGILNVHPSLLPRWRGPAPVVHTILHGDTMTGVSIMQIRPHRFDVGPILAQELHPVPENCTNDELRFVLAQKGAHLLIETLRTLPERVKNRVEQNKTGATSAPKIDVSMSWVIWEEHTCDQIDRLYRAIGSTIPLRTFWKGTPVKLYEFVGKCHVSLSDPMRQAAPGSVIYLKESNTLAIMCKDGWVGFKKVGMRKKLTGADFYNGYLHQSLKKDMCHQTENMFSSRKQETEADQMRQESS